MTRVVGLTWVLVSLLCSPPVLSAVTLDVPSGSISLPNAPKLGVVGKSPVVLRLNSAGKVALSWGGRDYILSEVAQGVPTLPVLLIDGSDVHAVWRTKLPAPAEGLGKAGDKFIWVRSSTDGGQSFGPAHRLSQGGGALLPYAVGNGQGALYVFWVDERYPERTQLFLNRSSDRGRTWQAQDVQVDLKGAIDPTLVTDGAQVWVAWMGGHEREVPEGSGPVEKTVVRLRRSADRGETWSDSVVVARVETPTTPALLRVKGKLLLYWVSPAGVEGAASADDGRTWTAIGVLPGSEGASGLAAAADRGSGRIVAAFTVSPNGEKPALFATSSTDGIRFETPVHLPNKPPHTTYAVLPEVAVDPSGSVIVIWQDSRYIRSTPCAALSRDGGRTWLPGNWCLEEEPGKFHALLPKVVGDGSGGFHTLWVRFLDDRLERSEAVVARVDAGRPPTGTSGDEAGRTRLEQRIGEFWKARAAAEWGKAYEFLDPIFRSRVRRESYIGTQGVVTYYDFSLTGVELTGRAARVGVRFGMEVMQLEVKGRKLSVPRREEEIFQEWVWLDGDWYLVFKDVMNQSFFRY